ncbi:MAG: hypothetical protein M1826_006495 [Phylliscum demangeonii]|nr:MAG: hypothetical protein M1826_006495 [Phylliscum demangeonii]
MRFFGVIGLAISSATFVAAFYPYQFPSHVPNEVDTTGRGLQKPSLCRDDPDGACLALTESKIEKVTGTLPSDAKVPHVRSVEHVLGESPLTAAEIKNGRSALPATPQPGGIHARAATPSYAYTVVSAVPPTAPTSLAIDQDGADFSYFSTVKLGASPKDYHLLIDTGAANTWVMGYNCTASACAVHNTFGPDDSPTVAISDGKWNVTYGTGSVSGYVANDTITLAGVTMPFTFGIANVVSDDFLSYPLDGILGLGRPTVDDPGVPTVMDAFKTQRKLKATRFGVNLQRNADHSNDGEVNFGDANRAKYDGDLGWSKCLSNAGVWEVAVDGAGVDGKAVKVTGKSAIIDTGSSFVLMPPDDARKLHALFPRYLQVGETFELPCSSTSTMQFTFSGVAYNVSSKDYLGKPSRGDWCYSFILGRQTFGPNQWLMGDTFLKAVYTVFDLDQSRVGFAQKKATSTGPTTLALSSPAPTTTPSSTSIPAGSSSLTAPSASARSTSAGDSTSSSVAPVSGGNSTAVPQTTSRDASSAAPTIQSASPTALRSMGATAGHSVYAAWVAFVFMVMGSW